METIKETLENWFSSNQNFLASFGLGVIVTYVAKKVFDCCSDVFNLYGGAFFLKKRLTGYGKWAVITGCTKGLGLEFSRQLAEIGLNLILVARNRIELEKVANEIEKRYKIKVIPVVADLSKKESFVDVFKIIDQQDVGILINNAGLMYEYPEYFHNVPDKILDNIINVNVSTSQTISHYVLKNQMVPKKKGLVVFLSSSACYQLTPMMTGYSASKKYIEYMAKCLRCEYASFDVFVQTLLPFYIATDMTKYSDALNKPSILSPSAKTYVRNALRTFGFAHETTGYLPHTVVRWCSTFIPERIWTFFAIYLMQYFRNSGQNKKL